MQQLTEMSFSEISEFTGFSTRMPSPEEVDILASELALVVVRNKNRDRKLSADQLAEEITRQVEICRGVIQNTGLVYVFKEVNKKVLFYSSLMMSLSNPHEYGNGLAQLIPGATLVTPQHNHLSLGLQAVIFDEENKIQPCLYKQIDICLLTTQSKKEENK